MSELDPRAVALSDDGIGGEFVEHKNVKYEIRPPTMAQQRDFSRLAKDKKTGEIDGVKLMVHAIIGCTFRADNGKQVFEFADAAALENKTTDPRGFVGKVSRVLNKLMSAKAEDVEASLEQSPTDS